ncbi:MAG: hypothetical protein MUF50_04290 [Planctomycetes bacterium]|jgi:rubrerythrin|nr:hypothetical protein [Planctomycetota bacterium]
MTLSKECSMSKDGILMNLQKGLESEKRAWQLCDEMLKVVKDEGDRKKIERIKNDEEKHIKITEELIATVNAFYLNN